MGVYIGIDIGGTKTMVIAVDENQKEIGRHWERTPEDPVEAIAQMHHVIGTLAPGASVLGIGMAIGGPIDVAAGTVSPLNLPLWRDVPMKRAMEERWGCPFHFGVDTDVAAIAEHHVAGVRVPRFLYVTVSTGLGGGFLLDGKVYRGLGGAHPEVGHQAIAARVRHPERVRCGCGNPDCLEALVSGSGIERIYGVPAAHLDPEGWDEVAFNLSQGLRNMITVLSPDLVVLGGGVTIGGGEHFLGKTMAYLRERLTLVPMPEIRVSGLGYDTALLGAAYIARDGAGLA